jgi:tetratricopeptide (TPR) repeat protein
VQSAIGAGNPKPENVAWCLADLGGIYWKIGRVDDAKAAYRRALTVYPNYYPAWAGLGRIASALNQVHDAIEDFRKAQDTVPMPEYAQALQDLYTRARAPKLAQQQGDLIDAIEITMRASGEKTNRNVALLYADQNRKLDRARELVDNEIRVRPDVYTDDALAWVLFRQGHFDDAWRASEKARALGTPEPVFHFHAGMIAEALGNKDAARTEFTKALALNRQFEFGQAAMARARLAAK